MNEEGQPLCDVDVAVAALRSSSAADKHNFGCCGCNGRRGRTDGVAPGVPYRTVLLDQYCLRCAVGHGLAKDPRRNAIDPAALPYAQSRGPRPGRGQGAGRTT